jgi:hypothetical protein
MAIVGEVLADNLQVIIHRSERTLRVMMAPNDQAKVPTPRPQMDPVTVNVAYEQPGNVHLTQTQEIAGMYIQAAAITADDIPTEVCDQCDAAERNLAGPRPLFFTYCKSYRDLQGGACANCVMKHRAAYCSLRKL